MADRRDYGETASTRSARRNTSRSCRNKSADAARVVAGDLPAEFDQRLAVRLAQRVAVELRDEVRADAVRFLKRPVAAEPVDLGMVAGKQHSGHIQTAPAGGFRVLVVFEQRVAAGV